MARAHKSEQDSSPLAYIFKTVANSLLYIVLLVSFLINGYLFARLQASGQSIFGFGSAVPSAAGAAIQPGTTGTGDTRPPANRENVDVGKGSLPALGNKDAKIQIVEFSDFQCPFCRRFYTETWEQLKKEYVDTNKVAIYFRHFPLDFHPSAFISAEASECANDQGKFWEMHDAMYNEQEKKGSGTTIQFTADDLKTWASTIGLDSGKFNECLDSGKFKEKVNKDMTEGATAGVSGTPTFFVNGTELVGAQPFSAFKAVIDKKLSE